MNKYNLFLDDLRPLSAVNLQTQRYPGYWKTATNYNEFCTAVVCIVKETGQLPQFISFDHDLAIEHYVAEMFDKNSVEYNKKYETFKEKTGMDCAKWLVEFCLDNNLPMCDFQVHSMNPVGKKNIESYLWNFKRSQND